MIGGANITQKFSAFPTGKSHSVNPSYGPITLQSSDSHLLVVLLYWLHYNVSKNLKKTLKMGT